jgi:hypothetical protein
LIDHQKDILKLQEGNKNLLKKKNDNKLKVSNLEKGQSKLKSIRVFDNLEIKNVVKLFYKGIAYNEEEYLKKKNQSKTKKIISNSISS